MTSFNPDYDAAKEKAMPVYRSTVEPRVTVEPDLCRAQQIFAASNNVIAKARTAVMFTNAKNLAALEHAVQVFDRLNRPLGAGGSEE